MYTPEEYAAKYPTEHGAQVALFMQCALSVGKYPELALGFAIPNGGQRGDGTDKGAMIAGSRLRAEGVRAAVSDTFFPIPRVGYHGLFIEMKKPGWKWPKTPSKHELEQQEFIDAMRKQGYGALFCAGYLEAWKTLEGYLTQ